MREEKVFELKLIHPRLRSGEWGFHYHSPGAAAIDLRCCLDHPVTLYPNHTPVVVPAGFAVSIVDPGYAALIVPRSGWGSRGLVIANTVGLIDSDYQGEVTLALWYRNPKSGTGFPLIEVKPGDRVAQMLFVPILRPAFSVVEEFTTTSERGVDGHGSTGER